MDGTIIVGLLSLAGSGLATLGGIVISSKLTNFRLQALENEVKEHNGFARRMPVVEEQIKVINHRITDLEKR